MDQQDANSTLRCEREEALFSPKPNLMPRDREKHVSNAVNNKKIWLLRIETESHRKYLIITTSNSNRITAQEFDYYFFEFKPVTSGYIASSWLPILRI